MEDGGQGLITAD